jgi:hypothetical protein
VIAKLVCVAALTLAGSACYDDGAPEPSGCATDGSQAVPNEGWLHVDAEDELVYEHNPPASGRHFPTWTTYAIHDEVVKRGHWVHNLEHGGVVLLIGPDATAEQRATLFDAYENIPDDPNCGHRRCVVTDDPLLDGPMAVVAADHVLEGDALTSEQIVAFATACRDRAPEDICW